MDHHADVWEVFEQWLHFGVIVAVKVVLKTVLDGFCVSFNFKYEIG